MENYKHSVSLDTEKCTGCTTCLKHCPTEAIRIRDGHAVINSDRCIDCGECIRVCPYKAKKAVLDSIADMERFKYKVALPAPSLYAQFDNLEEIDYVLQGLLDIGFDKVYEVARAAELVSAYTRNYLKTEGIQKPAISSACPAVVRLIELRFPSLKDNVIQMLPPMEIAAYLARKEVAKEHPEFTDDEIGVCFISPCPAKMSYVKNGLSNYKSKVDVVVPISDIYFLLINAMNRGKTPTINANTGRIGIGWAASGGEATAIFNDGFLAADGIEDVNRVLDEIENGNIPHVEFVELCACTGGCVGGVLTMQNPYIAKAKLRGLRRYLPISENSLSEEEAKYIPEHFFFEGFSTYRPISRLSDNMAKSMRMMADIQKLRETLPGYDCGACGAPTCRAFAEDVVKGTADIHDCMLKYKQEFKEFLKTSGEVTAHDSK